MILTHNHLRTTNIVQRRKLKTKSNPFMIDLIYGPSFKSYICQLNWSFLKGESLFGKVMYILLYLKWITNKDLLYSTGNSAQVTWQPGQEVEGEWIHVYIYGWVPSLFPWNYHNIVNWLYPNTKWFFVYKKNKIYYTKKKRRESNTWVSTCSHPPTKQYLEYWP